MTPAAPPPRVSRADQEADRFTHRAALRACREADRAEAARNPRKPTNRNNGDPQ